MTARAALALSTARRTSRRRRDGVKKNRRVKRLKAKISRRRGTRRRWAQRGAASAQNADGVSSQSTARRYRSSASARVNWRITMATAIGVAAMARWRRTLARHRQRKTREASGVCCRRGFAQKLAGGASRGASGAIDKAQRAINASD